MDACFCEVKPGYERSASSKRIWMYLNNSLHYSISVCVGDYSYHCMSRRMNKDLISKRICVTYIYIYIYRSQNTTKIWIRKIEICSLNVHNVHKHIGIRKHSKHLRLSFGSGTKLFTTFLSLRLFDMRRERHNFFLCWLFNLTPPRAAYFVDPNSNLN